MAPSRCPCLGSRPAELELTFGHLRRQNLLARLLRGLLDEGGVYVLTANRAYSCVARLLNTLLFCRACGHTNPAICVARGAEACLVAEYKYALVMG